VIEMLAAALSMLAVDVAELSARCRLMPSQGLDLAE